MPIRFERIAASHCATLNVLAIRRSSASLFGSESRRGVAAFSDDGTTMQLIGWGVRLDANGDGLWYRITGRDGSRKLRGVFEFDNSAWPGVGRLMLFA